MALHDEILREILAGTIKDRFRTGDLKTKPGSDAGKFIVGRQEYSESNLDTSPANYCTDSKGGHDGYHVREKGAIPTYIKYQDGVYGLEYCNIKSPYETE